VVVPVWPGECLAHGVGDRTRRQRDRFPVAGRRDETALGLLLARAVDDELVAGLVGEKALMRAAALQPAAVGVGEQYLGDHVVAIALAVALDDGDARAHRRADAERIEELPLLPRVQIPDQIRQVPRQIAVALR